jgi:predicted glycosyltransferase
MKYTFEIETSSGNYRLQNDESWRMLSNRKVMETDFTTSDVCTLIAKQEMDSEIVIGEKTWCLNPTNLSFGDTNQAYYEIYAHRRMKPLTPSIEQLRATIAQGDDRINNSLILNIYGFYELRDFSTLNLSFDDPTIVHRYETFTAGNDYVGHDAQNDNQLINMLYKTSLYFWLVHLQNGKTNMYFENEINESLEKILKDIHKVEI